MDSSLKGLAVFTDQIKLIKLLIIAVKHNIQHTTPAVVESF